MSIAFGVKFGDLTEAKQQEILEKLKEPFAPEDIDWKPQNIKDNKATALAFADPRVYIDRLNEVVGIGNWTRKFEFVTTPYIKTIKGKKPWGSGPDVPVGPDVITSGNKVMCICTVNVLGIEQSSTGETDASDDNAATSSEAQSFKRACIGFGLGKYLYDLPKFEAPYSYGKFTVKPTLPDWALPKVKCEQCKQEVKSITHNGTLYTAGSLVTNSKSKYGQALCAECQKERAKK